MFVWGRHVHKTQLPTMRAEPMYAVRQHTWQHACTYAQQPFPSSQQPQKLESTAMGCGGLRFSRLSLQMWNWSSKLQTMQPPDAGARPAASMHTETTAADYAARTTQTTTANQT
jgi:hypothetical protein